MIEISVTESVVKIFVYIDVVELMDPLYVTNKWIEPFACHILDGEQCYVIANAANDVVHGHHHQWQNLAVCRKQLVTITESITRTHDFSMQ